MTTFRLKHISRFRDRHGHMRHYLRLPGRKPLPLPGEPGSPEFMAAYTRGVAEAAPAAPPPAKTAPGSFDALVVAYYASGAFLGLRASTQRVYRLLVEQMRPAHGDKPVYRIDAIGIRALMAEKGTARAAANHRLRVLRGMMGVGVDLGMIATDPTFGVKRLKHKEVGFPTWTEDQIAAYEAHWPSGSRPRLALALLLYTAQRRSDVVDMGRQHLQGGMMKVKQGKTGTELLLPIHPALAAELAQVPKGQMVFLMTGQGAQSKPYTSGGFYNAFVAWAAEAGCRLSPHGGRKACARRLAEAGATTHEIAAMTGHKSLREVELYTKAAEQQRLAAAGMVKIVNKASNPKVQKLPTRRSKRPASST